MKGYRINAEVNVHDVDYNGIARASSILKYMQSAAQSQLTENGMSYDSLYGDQLPSARGYAADGDHVPLREPRIQLPSLLCSGA